MSKNAVIGFVLDWYPASKDPETEGDYVLYNKCDGFHIVECLRDEDGLFFVFFGGKTPPRDFYEAWAKLPSTGTLFEHFCEPEYDAMLSAREGEMSKHIKQSLLDLIPKGDGYNSAYAGTLSDAVEYIEQIVQQRDELAEALEGEYLLALQNFQPDRFTAEGQKRLCNLRDLIAKTRGLDAKFVQFEFEHKARAALAKVRGEDEAHEIFPGTLEQLRDLGRGK